VVVAPLGLWVFPAVLVLAVLVLLILVLFSIQSSFEVAVGQCVFNAFWILHKFFRSFGLNEAAQILTAWVIDFDFVVGLGL